MRQFYLKRSRIQFVNYAAIYTLHLSTIISFINKDKDQVFCTL